MGRNVLFILSDEHNPKLLGAAGHPFIKTPALDRLAREGRRYTAAYCASPICVPSRAALATGRYTHETGNWDNAFPYAGSHRAWGHDLIAAGHECVSIGKLHYRDAEAPTGFSRQIEPMHVIDGVGDLIGCIRTPPVVRSTARKYIVEARPGASTYQHYDARTAEAAAHWLGHKAQHRDGPGWVLFVSLTCPHFPLVAPPELMALYPEDSLPDPIAFAEGSGVHPALADYARFMDFSTPPFTPAETRRAMSAYFALVTYMDGLVGKVVDALDTAGLADETTVIYTSDHGDNNGRNGVFGKSTMYEDSAGVPLILRGPGIAAGEVVTTPVSQIDLYPTILDLVDDGVPDPARATRHGVSLASGTPPAERPILSEYHATCSTGGIFMLRWRHWKYIHYAGYPPQLFDLAADPDELTDLAAEPRCAEIRARLAAMLETLLDPAETDRRAKRDQHDLVARHGGPETVLAAGALGYTPAPGERPDRG